MSEYIERSSAAAYFENSKKVMWHKDDVVAAISSSAIPAADVAEVRHGYWIHTTTEDEDWGGTFHKWTCSVCNKSIGDDNPSGTDYCRYCGAKMDGKGEGDV